MSDEPKAVVHHLVARPLVVSEQKKPRRQRKPTLARALREAANAGVNVAGATIEDGKVSLTFGEVAKSNGNVEANPWDTVLNHASNQKRPS
jgi:hypothetical protein